MDRNKEVCHFKRQLELNRLSTVNTKRLQTVRDLIKELAEDLTDIYAKYSYDVKKLSSEFKKLLENTLIELRSK